MSEIRTIVFLAFAWYIAVCCPFRTLRPYRESRTGTPQNDFKGSDECMHNTIHSRELHLHYIVYSSPSQTILKILKSVACKLNLYFSDDIKSFFVLQKLVFRTCTFHIKAHVFLIKLNFKKLQIISCTEINIINEDRPVFCLVLNESRVMKIV